MIDTIFSRLTKDEIGGVELLSEIPCYLDGVGEHYYNGVPYISGNLNGFKVLVSSRQIKVRDGSLCKYYWGDNYKGMRRADIAMAIEKLSDELHLPMWRADVTRLDVAQNLIMRNPPDVYFNHLGQLAYAKRLMQPSGLYYCQNGGTLLFYDKNREQRAHREDIPELYIDRNVLRYERRYLNRLPNKFGVPEVKLSTLYDEPFYISMIDKWRESYKAIKKINDISLNFDVMKGRKDLYRMGVLSLLDRYGGQTEILNQIAEAQKRRQLSKKQALDLRNVINKVCNDTKCGLVVPNDAILELDKKIDEAVSFYR